MITAENGEKTAQELLSVADTLGAAMNQLDMIAKEGWQAITDEQEAYETVILDGEKMIPALRALAMRLDRGAYFKH